MWVFKRSQGKEAHVFTEVPEGLSLALCIIVYCKINTAECSSLRALKKSLKKRQRHVLLPTKHSMQVMFHRSQVGQIVYVKKHKASLKTFLRMR